MFRTRNSVGSVLSGMFSGGGEVRKEREGNSGRREGARAGIAGGGASSTIVTAASMSGMPSWGSAERKEGGSAGKSGRRVGGRAGRAPSSAASASMCIKVP